jgi:hypothetical protein
LAITKNLVSRGFKKRRERQNIFGKKSALDWTDWNGFGSKGNDIEHTVAAETEN